MPAINKIDAVKAFEFISEKNTIFRSADPAVFSVCTGGEVDEATYSAGEIITHPGDEKNTSGIGIIASGSASVYSGNGKRRVLLRYLGTGELYGVASLFSSAPAPTCIVACAGCTVLMLTRDAVRGMLHSDAAFLDAYLEFMSDRVLFLNRKITCVTGGNAERRLAVHLLSLTDPGSTDATDITPDVNFTELSRQLDIGRASLYRAFDALEAANAVMRGDGHTIRVYPMKLAELAGCDY